MQGSTGDDKDGSALVDLVQARIAKRIKAESSKLKYGPFASMLESRMRSRMGAFRDVVELNKAKEARAKAGEDEPEDEEDDLIDATVFDDKKSLTCPMTAKLFVDPVRNA
jgi:hypothetical protein